MCESVLVSRALSFDYPHDQCLTLIQGSSPKELVKQPLIVIYAKKAKARRCMKVWTSKSGDSWENNTNTNDDDDDDEGGRTRNDSRCPNKSVNWIYIVRWDFSEIKL
jgi:hypothetical protein